MTTMVEFVHLGFRRVAFREVLQEPLTLYSVMLKYGVIVSYVDDKRPGNSRQQIKYAISTFKKALASSTSIYRRVDSQIPSNDSYHEAAEFRLYGETS